MPEEKNLKILMPSLKKGSSIIFKKNGRGQKGVSLYLAVIILTILLGISLGLSSILVGQIKMVREMGNSVIAFYAADTGIEKTLYEISQGAGIDSHYEETLENGSTYTADVIAPNGHCLASNYCIKSVGIYKQIRRAIQVIR